MQGISLFSSAGIGELYLKDIGVEIVAANELIEKRAKIYSYFYPKTDMICGDIRKKSVKKKIKSYINDDISLLIATPPCQGLSSVGKNKVQEHWAEDRRNFLIFDILDIIDFGNFDYIIIENVPRFLKMFFPHGKEFKTLQEILNKKYFNEYIIDIGILDAKDCGIPQTRPRAIIKMYRKGLAWSWPKKEKIITLKEAIGHLPSLEAGEKSDIPWHYAIPHPEQIVEALKHTPPGKSALKNKFHYPKRKDGTKINGFHNTYKRMVWDQPAHARTTYCGSISSHNNVHPGRLLADGTYSDARVLTLLETFIVSSIKPDIKFPEGTSDAFIRTLIGESIPPLMFQKILREINVVRQLTLSI